MTTHTTRDEHTMKYRSQSRLVGLGLPKHINPIHRKLDQSFALSCADCQPRSQTTESYYSPMVLRTSLSRSRLLRPATVDSHLSPRPGRLHEGISLPSNTNRGGISYQYTGPKSSRMSSSAFPRKPSSPSFLAYIISATRYSDGLSSTFAAINRLSKCPRVMATPHQDGRP